ncbi:Utp8 family-domain-containing protein [Dipodascopsis tothii]|uniref:Utp8 family-domain-containing protein n=1 Tax=Dipodascopsis tothii TaxID=44089 RepID=UPI0034CFBCFF
MASLSAPFTIHTAAAGKIQLSSQSVSTVDVAVSGAGVSQFTLRPTPHLISSVGLSPLAEFLCPAVALTLERPVEKAAEAAEAAETAEGDADADEAMSDAADEPADAADAEAETETETETVKVLAVAVKEKKKMYVRTVTLDGDVLAEREITAVGRPQALFARPQGLVVVYASGQIALHQVADLAERWTAKAADKQAVVVAAFDKDDLIVVAKQAKDKKVRLRQIQVGDSYIEAAAWELDSVDKEKFAVHDGRLFRLAAGRVQIFTIGQAGVVSADVSKLAPTAMVPVTRSVVLLAADKKLHLVNPRYNLLLASVDAAEPVESLMRLSRRFVAGLTKAGGVVLVPYDVSKGRLVEYVTGSANMLAPAPYAGYAPAVYDVAYGADKFGKKVLESLAATRQDSDAFVAEAAALKKKKDSAGFDRRVVEYLSHGRATDGVFVLSHARNVDPAVVATLFGMLAPGFAPEHATTYLCSHPLLPTTPGLLGRAPKDVQPKLLRLSPNTFPLVDLVPLLVAHAGDDGLALLRPLLAHLLRHSYADVAAALHALPADDIERTLTALLAALDSPKRDLAFVANVWDLVPSLVDARGVWGLSEDVLRRLDADVRARVDILEHQAEAAVLVGELLRRVDVDA